MGRLILFPAGTQLPEGPLIAEQGLVPLGMGGVNAVIYRGRGATPTSEVPFPGTLATGYSCVRGEGVGGGFSEELNAISCSDLVIRVEDFGEIPSVFC